jgi:hypothetical protein
LLEKTLPFGTVKFAREWSACAFRNPPFHLSIAPSALPLCTPGAMPCGGPGGGGNQPHAFRGYLLSTTTTPPFRTTFVFRKFQ